MIQTLFGSPLETVALERFKAAIAKTRNNLTEQIENIIQGQKAIDEDLLDELEMVLIGSDIGVRTTAEILSEAREKLTRQQLADGKELKSHIAGQLVEILNSAPKRETVLVAPPEVILVVGVNGTGKTTTVGKLAYRFQQEGKKVLLCAGDTFRAAAAEQLDSWGHQTSTDVIKQTAGADPSAVLFDTIKVAKARGMDCVIADTAGRLHTKSNLMAELEKMKRTVERLVPGAPHQVLLVIDAITGQNGLTQAQKFAAAVGVTGIVLAKLDGTAKGGIVFAIARELGLPIHWVGIGEQVDDLIEFDSHTFVHSLFED